MDNYEVELIGQTPLIMHNDNLLFSEEIQKWRKDPNNKAVSVSGDDRSPAWTWIGYLYHDNKHVGIPSDNLMTMLREGGAKVRVGGGRETYKKQTQSGIDLSGFQYDLFIKKKRVPVAGLLELVGELDFSYHVETVEKMGFELLCKRAKINKARHVRVRPIFEDWTLKGRLRVRDPKTSGISESVLQTILEQAGALCGLGDWRPSSPSSGRYGTFKAKLKKNK